jgi:hypothetical protein
MKQLFNLEDADGDSATQTVGRSFRGGYRLAKVLISGTATVTLYGRAATNDTWTSLAVWTSSGLLNVSLPTQIKFTISGASSAAVSAWIDADEY